MKTTVVLIHLAFTAHLIAAQVSPAGKINLEESNVPAYILPDPLLFNDGSKVEDINDWKKRRKEILEAFETEMYGAAPKWRGQVLSQVRSTAEVFGGTGERREVLLKLKNRNKELDISLLIYLPRSSNPAPVFLGYNFSGNHTVTHETDIAISSAWVPNSEELNIRDNKANEASRGAQISRWPVKEMLERGYGLATLYYGEVDPDFDDGFGNGVHALFDARRDSSSWGSIAAWAWGLSRAMDYLETDGKIDNRKVIAIGHSRLGKAALWAGALDQRFAIVISNNSGCGGAALSKRVFGESVSRINRSFPHWFSDNFKKYSDKEEDLPMDQHQLIALMAPRPVYVASATGDLWADPRGEFLSAFHAGPVYRLFNLDGTGVSEVPQPEHPVGDFIGYHLRKGQHDITIYDWTQYMNFADRHFKK